MKLITKSAKKSCQIVLFSSKKALYLASQHCLVGQGGRQANQNQNKMKRRFGEQIAVYGICDRKIIEPLIVHISYLSKNIFIARCNTF
jgi:hypothetical protein